MAMQVIHVAEHKLTAYRFAPVIEFEIALFDLRDRRFKNVPVKNGKYAAMVAIASEKLFEWCWITEAIRADSVLIARGLPK